jgi:hypothetical protein
MGTQTGADYANIAPVFTVLTPDNYNGVALGDFSRSSHVAHH